MDSDGLGRGGHYALLTDHEAIWDICPVSDPFHGTHPFRSAWNLAVNFLYSAAFCQADHRVGCAFQQVEQSVWEGCRRTVDPGDWWWASPVIEITSGMAQWESLFRGYWWSLALFSMRLRFAGGLLQAAFPIFALSVDWSGISMKDFPRMRFKSWYNKRESIKSD